MLQKLKELFERITKRRFSATCYNTGLPSYSDFTPTEPNINIVYEPKKGKKNKKS